MLHFQHLRVALGIHDQCVFFSEKKAKYGEIILDLELEIMKDLIQTRPQALCRALALLVLLSVSKTGACFGGQGNQCTESVQSLRYLSQDVVRCC